MSLLTRTGSAQFCAQCDRFRQTSFADPTQDQVRLIAGPNVFTFEDCVALCTEGFKDEPDDPRIHRTTEAVDRLP